MPIRHVAFDSRDTRRSSCSNNSSSNSTSSSTIASSEAQAVPAPHNELNIHLKRKQLSRHQSSPQQQDQGPRRGPSFGARGPGLSSGARGPLLGAPWPQKRSAGHPENCTQFPGIRNATRLPGGPCKPLGPLRGTPRTQGAPGGPWGSLGLQVLLLSCSHSL